MKLQQPIGLVLIVTSVLIAGCTHQDKTTAEFAKHNSIYYWKTTFALDSTERAFLTEHDIDRIYLHMFDVAVEPDYETGGTEVVPIATTRFEASVPDGVEVVPVAYITLDALRAMLEQFGIEPEAVAYMGDDLPDLPAMRMVGLAARPADGHAALEPYVHWTAPHAGGHGAVRDFAELILTAQHQWQRLLESNYLSD